jgi:muramoyltetrapeptide carboxypeptidase
LRNRAPGNIGVAIVAPGGYAPDEAALERGIAALQAQGCRVRNYYSAAAKHQRFGGIDDARVAQLHAAAGDPDVQVVLALRGGYGMSRLLPAIDLKLLAASGKLFVGHSDFTALHMALLAQTGAVSFAGPMVCDDFTRPDLSDFTMQHFWQCITVPDHTVFGRGNGNPAVDVSGILWGGNLATLTHLVGTPYFPKIDDGILFVEDVNEHPYRIERMLLQLLHAGVLARQKAILLGDFSSFRLTEYDNGYDFDAMLAYLRTQVQVPILTGLPFGHLPDKVTLPVGGRAHLTCDGGPFQLALSGYPFLGAFQ